MPVTESITAASVGTGLNVKVPPGVPVTVAVAPSHVGVIVNEASSEGLIIRLKAGVKETLLHNGSPTLSILT